VLRTYKAVLRGDHIEWIDTPPPTAGATPVHVTLLEDVSSGSAAERGRAMAEALEALSSTGALADIEDPAAWQRELRRDRSLPGRER
jgi:hypothetical protein